MLNRRQLTIAILKHALRSFIAVAGAVVIVVLAGRRIGTINTQLQERKSAAFTLSSQSETLTALRDEFKLIGNGDVAVRNAFPPADNILDFTSRLDSLANAHSLRPTIRFHELQVTSPDQPFAAGNIPFTVSSNGTLDVLIGYLEEFERLPYLTTITAISMTSPPSGGWNADSSVSLEGTVYIRQPGT